jgi:hypothetical protein
MDDWMNETSKSQMKRENVQASRPMDEGVYCTSTAFDPSCESKNLRAELKAPVKVRLARKYEDATVREGNRSLQHAYLAGFDKAKALYMDAVMRFCDEFVPKDRQGKKISEHLAMIGELP